MPTFDVAKLTEKNASVVIVFLPPETASLGDVSREQLRDMLRRSAAKAGMRGDVLAVWEYEGRISFMAPLQWHEDLRNSTLSDLARLINDKLVIEEPG